MHRHYHSTTRKLDVKVDRHSRTFEIVGVFVDGRLLKSFVRYLVQKRLQGRRQGWMKKSVQSLRMLIDYSIANKGCFESPRQMFETFAERLFEGTIDPSEGDPTFLFWAPRSTNSGNEILYHITTYSDWLYDYTNGESELLNPQYQASRAEQILNLAAWNHRVNNSFLKHTFTMQEKNEFVTKTRLVMNKHLASTSANEVVKFPQDRIWDLLLHGFRKRGTRNSDPVHKKYDISNILITMLMHFGGLRLSEVFHIYVDDIIPNDGFEQIRVYHPSEGIAPEWYRSQTNKTHCTRKEFLSHKFGLEPRHTNTKKMYHAGWKNPPTNKSGKYFEVFLFAPQDVKKLFFDLFKKYILESRIAPLPGREHPFLFTNQNGDPRPYPSFYKTHRIAVMRIGMQPYHAYGGCVHCHRHAYGQSLSDHNVDPIVTKCALHHSNLESQNVYTEPENKKVRAILNQAIKTQSNSSFAGYLYELEIY